MNTKRCILYHHQLLICWSQRLILRLAFMRHQQIRQDRDERLNNLLTRVEAPQLQKSGGQISMLELVLIAALRNSSITEITSEY